MIGFESFSVSAWYDNGLTKHVVKPISKMKRGTSKVFASALMGAAIIAASMAPVTANAMSFNIEKAAMTSVKSAPDPEVSAGYWPALMNEMKSWAPVSEPDIDYPD